MVDTSPHGSAESLSHINPFYDENEDGVIEYDHLAATAISDFNGVTFSGYPLTPGVDTSGSLSEQETGTFPAPASTLSTQTVSLSKSYTYGMAQAFFQNTALSPLSDADCAIQSYSLGSGSFTVLFHNSTASSETVEWRFIGRV